MKLTEAQLSALRWLAEHGGEGVVDQYGRVVAQGERYGTGDNAATWLRLFTTGHIESAGDYRLKLTGAGYAADPKRRAWKVPVDQVLDSDFSGARERAPMLDEEDEE